VIILRYRNAKGLLPKDLLEKIQEYVQGEIIYVPCEERKRAKWGEVNGTRKKYIKRNKEIKILYKEGIDIDTLASKFYLSEHSIKKIISTSY
jgi:Mor family transcriptional regulator